MQALICFTFNKDFCLYLESLIEHLLRIEGVEREPARGIPLHMTIWGGLDMNCVNWQERLERAALMLRPFHGKLPRIVGLDGYQMSIGGYGVKLDLRNFIMTSDRKLNRELCNFVGGKKFDLAQPRHITLCRIKKEWRDACREGEVYDTCNRFACEYIDSNPFKFSGVVMTPEIFVKRSQGWGSLSLRFLRCYGIDWDSRRFQVCEPEV